MLYVLKTSWPLLLGVLLLLIGNGLQGTLLGIRGGIEGYDAATMSLVMSGYYVGFLIGSQRATVLIARVGHVRVFAALGSLISAAFILYAEVPQAWAWALLRVLVGYSFAGVYVVAESWLNNAATNETRGQALSLYMIVQMVGDHLGAGPPQSRATRPATRSSSSCRCWSRWPSCRSCSPPAPRRRSRRPSRCRLRQLFRISPLGCVGTFLLGGVFAAIFGMASVFGTQAGMSVAQISIFVAAIYLGGLVFQYPIGWVSDRMDRRLLIMGLTGGGRRSPPSSEASSPQATR